MGSVSGLGSHPRMSISLVLAPFVLILAAVMESRRRSPGLHDRRAFQPESVGGLTGRAAATGNFSFGGRDARAG